MNNLFANKDNRRRFFFSFILPGVALIAICLIFIPNIMKEQRNTAAEPESVISKQDESEVKSMTNEFFKNFKEGNPLNEQIFTDLTFDYFNPEFLENDLSQQKEKLFGLYGFLALTNTFTSTDGVIEEGSIKTFEIESIQKDNANKTITTYVRMDAQDQNQTHWIEWRDIPGEGWKINALTFNGNIESLSNPLTPKKNTD